MTGRLVRAGVAALLLTTLASGMPLAQIKTGDPDRDRVDERYQWHRDDATRSQRERDLQRLENRRDQAQERRLDLGQRLEAARPDADSRERATRDRVRNLQFQYEEMWRVKRDAQDQIERTPTQEPSTR